MFELGGDEDHYRLNILHYGNRKCCSIDGLSLVTNQMEYQPAAVAPASSLSPSACPWDARTAKTDRMHRRSLREPVQTSAAAEEESSVNNLIK